MRNPWKSCILFFNFGLVSIFNFRFSLNDQSRTKSSPNEIRKLSSSHTLFFPDKGGHRQPHTRISLEISVEVFGNSKLGGGTGFVSCRRIRLGFRVWFSTGLDGGSPGPWWSTVGPGFTKRISKCFWGRTANFWGFPLTLTTPWPNSLFRMWFFSWTKKISANYYYLFRVPKVSVCVFHWLRTVMPRHLILIAINSASSAPSVLPPQKVIHHQPPSPRWAHEDSMGAKVRPGKVG